MAEFKKVGNANSPLPLCFALRGRTGLEVVGACSELPECPELKFRDCISASPFRAEAQGFH